MPRNWLSVAAWAAVAAGAAAVGLTAVSTVRGVCPVLTLDGSPVSHDPALTAQLAVGGTLVAPVGPSGGQSLLCLRKDADGRIAQRDLGPVIFVPLLSGMVDR